jgi:cell division protein FtsB
MTSIILIVLIVWLAAMSIILWQMVSRYRRLTHGIKKKELRSFLENAISQLKKQKKATDELETWIKNLQKQEEEHLQKVGFVRFNPFIDTGSNQSFSLAILDRHDNGIVISSLHSREHTRIYAKAITKGKAEGHELSKEEKEAIKKAQKSSS